LRKRCPVFAQLQSLTGAFFTTEELYQQANGDLCTFFLHWDKKPENANINSGFMSEKDYSG
jgi:hypothetical protein